MPTISDQYGRAFRTLRVSLLSHCNLGCVYCVAGEEETRERGGRGLGAPELVEIIGRLHRRLGLGTVRLTGGEPLLYPELTGLIEGIGSLGIAKLKLTTNGYLLERKAASLKQAGLQSVNISLDAVDEQVFVQMSRRHSVGRIIRGIDAALDAGLAVKLNAVIMKGMNDAQVLPLLEFAFSRGITIRFLEVMAMGHLFHQAGRYLFTQEEMLQKIRERFVLTPVEREASATARYWVTETGHRFGIIANESEPFCRDCDRLRLDSAGNIYGCLSSNHPIALDRLDSGVEWDEKLRKALEQKQALRFTGSDLSMLKIGG
jgi:GTP 3',8-cyclase